MESVPDQQLDPPEDERWWPWRRDYDPPVTLSRVRMWARHRLYGLGRRKPKPKRKERTDG